MIASCPEGEDAHFLEVSHMGRPNGLVERKWTEAQKAEAISIAMRKGAMEASEITGIPSSTIRSWTHRRRKQLQRGHMRAGKQSALVPDPSGMPGMDSAGEVPSGGIGTGPNIVNVGKDIKGIPLGQGDPGGGGMPGMDPSEDPEGSQLHVKLHVSEPEHVADRNPGGQLHIHSPGGTEVALTSDAMASMELAASDLVRLAANDPDELHKLVKLAVSAKADKMAEDIGGLVLEAVENALDIIKKGPGKKESKTRWMETLLKVITIGVDKHQILTGGATSRIESTEKVVSQHAIFHRVEQYAEVYDRLAGRSTIPEPGLLQSVDAGHGAGESVDTDGTPAEAGRISPVTG